MKKSKIVAILVITIILTTTLFSCAATNDTASASPAQSSAASQPNEAQSSAATTSTSNQPVSIHIYQSKYEIDAALKAACDEYTKLHPNVTFNVESTNSNDFQTELKAMFSGGTAPDIFSTQGYVDLATMADYMVDLSNEPWAQYMSTPAKQGGTYQGKILGFPLAVEGHGYLYHKDIFKEAGITDVPKTRTELENDCKILQAKGITPFSSNYSDWYQAAMFELNSPIARQADPLAFIDSMNKGTGKIVGNQDFEDMAALIGLEVKYGKNPTTVDFNTQVSDFANKKTAMMLGGTWSQSALDQVDPNMDVGMFPMPMSDDASKNDKFYADSSPFWSINKDSKCVDECKKFLTWLATDPEGQKNITTGFKLIPAFTNIKADPSALGPTGSALIDYINSGKIYGIYNAYYPKGMGGAQIFGESITKYAAGKLTPDQLLDELQQDWASAQS
jgi:ABC-type sugar transport system, periplasmic component